MTSADLAPLLLAAGALLAAGYALGRGWHRAALALLAGALGAGAFAAGRASARAEPRDDTQADGGAGLDEPTEPHPPPRDRLPLPPRTIPDYIEEAEDEAAQADPRRTGGADYADEFVERARADGVLED